jgi:uncharacterized protein HemY
LALVLALVVALALPVGFALAVGLGIAVAHQAGRVPHSFSTLMICSSVNLLVRMSVSRRERILPKIEGV